MKWLAYVILAWALLTFALAIGSLVRIPSEVQALAAVVLGGTMIGVTMHLLFDGRE